MAFLRKYRRHLIILLITVLFALFLIRFNDIDRIGLYSSEGKTFEKARVVEILKDNETESGNQIGNQIVSLELLSGKFKGNIVEAVSSSSYLYGAHCEAGMRVIAEVNESDDSLYVTVYSQGPYMDTVCHCSSLSDYFVRHRRKTGIPFCRSSGLYLCMHCIPVPAYDLPGDLTYFFRSAGWRY